MCFYSKHQTVSNSKSLTREMLNLCSSFEPFTWFKDVSFRESRPQKKRKKRRFIYHEVPLTDVLENTTAPDNVCTVKCTDVGYLQRNRAQQSQFEKAAKRGEIKRNWNGLRWRSTRCFPARMDCLCYWERLENLPRLPFSWLCSWLSVC